jgi:hypothetical protein
MDSFNNTSHIKKESIATHPSVYEKQTAAHTNYSPLHVIVLSYVHSGPTYSCTNILQYRIIKDTTQQSRIGLRHSIMWTVQVNCMVKHYTQLAMLLKHKAKSPTHRVIIPYRHLQCTSNLMTGHKTLMPYKDELTVKNEISKLDTKICMQYFLHICIFCKLNMQAKSSIKVSCVDMFIIHFTAKTRSHCTYLKKKRERERRET